MAFFIYEWMDVAAMHDPVTDTRSVVVLEVPGEVLGLSADLVSLFP